MSNFDFEADPPEVDLDRVFAWGDPGGAPGAEGNGASPSPPSQDGRAAVRPSTSHKAVSLGEGDEPGEREWVVDHLIPAGHLTILSGDGGTGKSMVALELAFCAALGEPFFDIGVAKGPVLWLDAENLGLDEVKRRAFQVARGRGMDRPPPDLFYYACEKPAGHAQTIREVGEAVGAVGVKLAILDSLTIGAGGADMSNQKDVVALLKEVFRWGVTVLALDHITKASRESGQEKASIFGSVHKRNMARSTLRLYVKDGLLHLAQDKSNFGPVQPPTVYGMKFEESEGGQKTVAFEQAEAAPMFSDGKPVVLNAADKTLRELRRLFEEKGGPVSVADLAEARKRSEKTLRNDLTALCERGDVIRQGGGLYIPNDEIVID